MRSRRLTRVLRDIVSLTIASASVYACSSSNELGADMETACGPGIGNTARTSGLRPSNPVDFMAFRFETIIPINEGEPEIHVEEIERSGEPCKSAADRPECEKKLADLRVSTTAGSPSSYLVFTRGDQVLALKTPEEIKQFLLPIDTKEEAFLLATQKGFDVTCSPREQPKWEETDDGFELLVHSFTSSCLSTDGHVDRVVVAVSRNGDVAEVERERARDVGPCSEGRRPRGLRSNGRAKKPRSNLGAYFAKASHLEAASVVAFEQLERELAALGAPQRLLRALASARADEVRHAEVTSKLARRFGATPPSVRVKKAENRSALAIAIENAREGCVRETLGAVVALYRAERAADPEVARAMRSIAADELRHARLSWEMMEWLNDRLTARGRAAVRRAFEREIAALADELSDPPADVAEIAGAPSAATLRALFDRVAADVWSSALAAA